MGEPLFVADNPCPTCPYRKDTPPGVWHESEYKKLPAYDTNEAFETFLCHYSPTIDRNAVCRGWLSVHRESVAARLACINGSITPDQLYAEVSAELYPDGATACAAGLKGVNKPSRAARRKIESISKQRRAARRKRGRR